jgi:hypothetical protein
MSIVSVEKGWSRTSSQGSSSDGKTFSLSFTEGWQVVHSADATELEILNAPGLPQVRDFYPDTFVPCTSVGPVSKLGPIFSIVMIQYDGEVGPNGFDDPPENKLPEYTWSDSTTSEAIDEDWDGNPIVTANDEPIQGVTMDIADQTLTITRNYLLFSPWLTHQYRHSVNSDAFAGYPAGTARLVGFSASNQVSENGSYTYWKVNAKVQFRYPYNTTAEKAWYARVRHEGFYVKVDGNVVRATDDYGEPTTKPVLLKADGTEETDSDNAHWLEFKRYQPLPYAALGLI